MPGTGEDLCLKCNGTGKLEGGKECPECCGTGKVVRAVGGG
jgi:RecJ-like exonuclease